jgi:hypothetical protein
MKIIILLLLTTAAIIAHAQNPIPVPVPPRATPHPLSKPGSTSLAKPTPSAKGQWKTTVGRVPVTPAPGPVVGTIVLEGYVIQRTATGLLVRTQMPGDNGLVWLTGQDYKAETWIQLVARKTGPVNCPTLYGDRILDGYAVEMQK